MCPLYPNSTSLPTLFLQAVRAQALGDLIYTSNSHWLSVLHMAGYMFQCYSLKSSHSLLFPLNSESVLYVCVSFLTVCWSASFSALARVVFSVFPQSYFPELCLFCWHFPRVTFKYFWSQSTLFFSSLLISFIFMPFVYCFSVFVQYFCFIILLTF